MPDHALELLEKIRIAPDIETWVTVIRLVMAGALDGYIENHFDTVEDLMLTTIENSLDKPWAKTCFEEGLERVLSSWTPVDAAEESTIESALRLLQTFRPRVGVERLLSYMLDGHAFTVFRFDTEHSDMAYLDLLAWNTLRAYFPLENKDRSTLPNYDDYIRFLEGSLTRHGTRALACQRLLEMGVMKPQSDRLRRLVADHPSTLVVALVEWLNETDRVDRSLLIEELYQHCTGSEAALAAFETTLKRLGGRVSGVEPRLELHLPSGNVVSVSSPGKYFEKEISEFHDGTAWLASDIQAISRGIR